MKSDHCPVSLSVLSVTLVYCGQTVGRTKMKLGMQVRLGPGHCVLNGDPAHTKRGTHRKFQPMSVVAKRLDWLSATWHGGRSWPRRLCVRWGPSFPPPQKKREQEPPIFGPCLLWQNSWMDEDATRYRGRPRPGPCLLWPMARWIKMPLGREVGLGQGNIMLDGPCLLWPNDCPCQLLVRSCKVKKLYFFLDNTPNLPMHNVMSIALRWRLMGVSYVLPV